MDKDKLLITLKDTTDKTREMIEIHEMLKEISSIADRYGYKIPHVDVGITVILSGKIRPISCDIKFE